MSDRLLSAPTVSFDTPRESEFGELAQVASDIYGAAIALVNLVDTTRQFFKAEVGLASLDAARVAKCSHALLEEIAIFSDPQLMREAYPKKACSSLNVHNSVDAKTASP